MAYENYLIKVGDYEIPLKYMNADTYNAYMSVLDLDSYTDANGKLHRNALSHTPNKVEFETIPMLTSSEFAEIMNGIKNNYLVARERKANVTAFIPEKNAYVTQEMYMPDIVPVIYGIINGEVRYRPIRLAFIGY